MPTPAKPSERPPPVAIVVARYNQTITYNLRAGAVAAYLAAGGQESDLAIIEAAGTFELPLLAQEAASIDSFGGVVALGCVMRGETDHDKYLADAVTKALLDVGLETGVPIGLGVLTVNNVKQAVARSGGIDGSAAGNKGADAMNAVLATLAAIEVMAEASDAGKGPGLRFVLPIATPDKTASASDRAAGTGKSSGSAKRPATSKVASKPRAKAGSKG